MHMCTYIGLYAYILPYMVIDDTRTKLALEKVKRYNEITESQKSQGAIFVWIMWKEF